MKISISKLLLSTLLLAGLSACNEEGVLPPVPEPEGGVESIGNGDWDNPLSVYQAQCGYTTDETGATNQVFWVCGYIVGWIDTDATPSHVLNAESARFTAPATIESNILIAMDPEEKDWTKCAPVQLPSGPVRNALSLGNASNLGKQVTIKGQVSKYCGEYGVRSVEAYAWGDKGIYEEPQDPVPPVPGIVENVTFRKVADVDGEGQYLLVFEGNLLAGPVEPSSYSYGYLPVATVTVSDDTIITSTLNSYYFYTADGGWNIRDGYGRYVWWDSEPSHKSFQLTTKRGSEGMVWTVTPAASGTVEIKNVEMNVTMGYNSQYNNVGAYSSVTSGLPSLYKRVN